MAYFELWIGVLLVLKVTSCSCDKKRWTLQNIMNTFNLINDGGQLYSFLVIPVHWLKMKYQYFFENSINFFRVEKKNTFTISYSKVSNMFFVLSLVAWSTLKLLNNTRCKIYGNRIFEAKTARKLVLTC